MQLGIDFGTCFSSAALVLDPSSLNSPRLLKPGNNNSSAIPSCLFLEADGSRLFGQTALNNFRKDPTRFLKEFKRDLGSPDPYHIGDQELLPEQCVEWLLKWFREDVNLIAQQAGKGVVDEVVLTIPATYLKYKRDLMSRAAERAGFSQVSLLEEPVAAALYYEKSFPLPEGEVILVYDLGGGTFDAALLKKEKGEYRILGVPVGLERCGGVDFDRAIYQWVLSRCSDELRAVLEHRDIARRMRARIKLEEECVKAKHALSESSVTSVVVEVSLDVEEFDLRREEFEGMISSAIEQTVQKCEQMVEQANLKRDEVGRIVLVGGSSRIPLVSRLLEEKFRCQIYRSTEMDLAVCLGSVMYTNNQVEPLLSVTDPVQSIDGDIVHLYIINEGRSWLRSWIKWDAQVKIYFDGTYLSEGGAYLGFKQYLKTAPGYHMIKFVISQFGLQISESYIDTKLDPGSHKLFVKLNLDSKFFIDKLLKL